MSSRFIHREAHYIEKSPEYRAGDAAATAAYIEAKNKAEIIIGKNRAGPTRTDRALVRRLLLDDVRSRS